MSKDAPPSTSTFRPTGASGEGTFRPTGASGEGTVVTCESLECILCNKSIQNNTKHICSFRPSLKK
jgi:hypothetical protein